MCAIARTATASTGTNRIILLVLFLPALAITTNSGNRAACRLAMPIGAAGNSASERGTRKVQGPLLRLEGLVLELRGGGKGKTKENMVQKRAVDDEDRSTGKKRAREDKMTLKQTTSDDEETTGDTGDSVDELAYSTPPSGDEWGGKLGTHVLGTVPMEVSRRPTSTETNKGGKKGGSAGQGSDSSESYPGCYGDTSSSWEEEADEEERTGPPPTREELIRRIRDRPFNTTALAELASETEKQMRQDEEQALREIEEEKDLRRTGKFIKPEPTSTWEPKRVIKGSDTRKPVPHGAGGVVGKPVSGQGGERAEDISAQQGRSDSNIARGSRQGRGGVTGAGGRGRVGGGHALEKEEQGGTRCAKQSL